MVGPERGRFDFFDEWRVAARPDVVWTAVRDVGTWPQWWRSVRSVTLLDAPGAQVVHAFRFRTRLPYDMAFVASVLHDDGHGVEAWVTGRVDGRGSWRVEPVDGGTLVRFDWWVRPQLAWMKAVAPLARPVFSWNHRSLMAEGARGLAARLDTSLLAPPVGVLLP